MRQQHVEVTLVHRHIGRLTDRAARMVQPFGHIAQLHEIAEILDGRITAATFGIAHEGRAVDRRQHQIATADLDIALGVAGVLGERPRRGLGQLARQPTGNMHPLAPHIGACGFPQLQRGRVLDEIDADFFQHRLGVVLDDLKRFFVQNLEIRDVALDEPRGFERHRRPLCPPGRTTTPTGTTPPTQIAHIRGLLSYFSPYAREGRPSAPEIRRLSIKSDIFPN